ncbi:Basic-leucine zipper transcription factor family protein, partial [Prunus dulcis]
RAVGRARRAYQEPWPSWPLCCSKTRQPSCYAGASASHSSLHQALHLSSLSLRDSQVLGRRLHRRAWIRASRCPCRCRRGRPRSRPAPRSCRMGRRTGPRTLGGCVGEEKSGSSSVVKLKFLSVNTSREMDHHEEESRAGGEPHGKQDDEEGIESHRLAQDQDLHQREEKS